MSKCPWEKCPNVRGEKCLNVRREKCPNVRGGKCPNVRGEKCPNVRGEKCPNVRGEKNARMSVGKKMPECPWGKKCPNVHGGKNVRCGKVPVGEVRKHRLFSFCLGKIAEKLELKIPQIFQSPYECPWGEKCPLGKNVQMSMGEKMSVAEKIPVGEVRKHRLFSFFLWGKLRKNF